MMNRSQMTIWGTELTFHVLCRGRDTRPPPPKDDSRRGGGNKGNNFDGGMCDNQDMDYDDRKTQPPPQIPWDQQVLFDLLFRPL